MDPHKTRTVLGVTIDERPDFVEAVSLCAELEALCETSVESRQLAYVGLARCELTEVGMRLPATFCTVLVPSVDDGLARMDDLLTTLLREADGLETALRLHEARELVRDARST